MIESKSISQLEINKLIQKGRKILIIDVRSQEEYSEKHILNAINVTIEQIEKEKLVLEKGSIVVTACGKGGGRSEKASNYIKNHYDVEVYFLENGTFGWID